MRRIVATGRFAASAGAVALITVWYLRLVHVNPMTAAVSYPMTILVAFLATAIFASRFSGRAHRREIDATAKGRDLERLYALSRALLQSADGASITTAIANRIAEVCELKAVAIYDLHTDTVSWAGSRELPEAEQKLRDGARQGAASVRDPSGLVITAIEVGGAPIASLGLPDAGLSDTVLQSIANLTAIGLERARAQAATARPEAARQTGELPSVGLDPLAHKFKTPL